MPAQVPPAGPASNRLQVGTCSISLLLLALLCGACAAGRHINDLRVEDAKAPPAAPMAPVALGLIRDARIFEAKPRRADVPSLAHADEIADRGVTERAYGRLRGGFGKAMGDMLLPEGRTVPAVVRQVVSQALKQRGYQLVRERDPRAPHAPRIDITIERFWSYFRPGFAAVAVEFVTQLHISGNLPGLEGGLLIETQAELRKGVMTETRWVQLVERGLSGLTQEISRKLPPASAATASAAGRPTVQASGGEQPTGDSPSAATAAAPSGDPLPAASQSSGDLPRQDTPPTDALPPP
jgi:hypothetical protein